MREITVMTSLVAGRVYTAMRTITVQEDQGFLVIVEDLVHASSVLSFSQHLQASFFSTTPPPFIPHLCPFPKNLYQNSKPNRCFLTLSCYCCFQLAINCLTLFIYPCAVSHTTDLKPKGRQRRAKKLATSCGFEPGLQDPPSIS